MTSKPSPDTTTLQSLLDGLGHFAEAHGMGTADLLARLNRATVVEATLRAGLHDLKNPLQSIVMSGGILSTGETDPIRAARLQGFILEAAQRADRIAKELAQVDPDRQPGTTEAIALPDIVSSCTRLQEKPGVSETISIEVALPASLPPAFGDKAAVRHTLLNVLLNMREALEERGGGAAWIRGEEHGEFVHLIVENDGPQVPDEIAERIFEPFFTTKTAGPATPCHLGLGLPVARHMIEGFGGSLTRNPPANSSGIGFVLRLPTAGPDASA
jgi:C4-dicarboxylate-specific signal transduction histidine kinase